MSKAHGNVPDTFIIIVTMKVKVKVTQSCPTLCHPMDYTVHGILRARILESVAFSFSWGSPHPGIKPRSLPLQANSLPTELRRKPSSSSSSLPNSTTLWGGFGSEGKASACNAGDLGSIPGLGRSPEEGNGNPLQYYPANSQD